MKRRDVIKLGAVATGAVAGVPGCAVPLGSMKGEDGAKAFNAMIDEQIGGLEQPGFLFKLVEQHTGSKLPDKAREALAEKDALFRGLLGALLVTQGFRDLDNETQLQPAVQQRMWQHMDQVANVGLAVGEMLATLDNDERRAVQRGLRAQPDLPLRIAESVDARAGRAGISQKRRLQWRRLMTQTGFRLKHGDPGILIDEYVQKVERLHETTARDAAVLDVARQAGDREYWRNQRRLAEDDGTQPTTPPTAPPPPPKEPLPTVAEQYAEAILRATRKGDCVTVDSLLAKIRELDPDYHREVLDVPEVRGCRQAYGNLPQTRPVAPVAPFPVPILPRRRPGQSGLRVGGYMFGIGLVTGLASVALLATQSEALILGGLVGLTAGVVLVALGLIVLFFSALIYAAN